MKLESDKIYLRPYEVESAPIYYYWFYSGKYDDYFRHCSEAYRIGDFRRYVENPATKIFTVFEKSTNQIVGTCGIYDFNQTDRRCKFMTLIDETHQGKNYMGDCLVILGKLAVDCHIHKMQVEVLETNTRLLEHSLKMGLKKEYVELDSAFVNGKFVNEVVFYLMEDEFKEKYYGSIF